MIDEKKLIEELKNHPNLFKELGWSIECIDIESVIETINEQPKTDWIPCEERLPKEMEEVLISKKNSKSGTSIGYYNKVFGWYDQCLLRGVTDVVAWMPKPQPYKKEGAE